MIDIASTISSYLPFCIEADLLNGIEWQDIGLEQVTRLVGVAMESIHTDILSEAVRDSGLLDNAVITTAYVMKTGLGKGELARDMRDIFLGWLVPFVEKAYEQHTFSRQKEQYAGHGFHPSTSRETGELQWTRI